METLKQERCLGLPWRGWEAGGVLFRVVGRVVVVGGTLVDSVGFLVVGLRVAAVDGTPMG